MKLPYVFIPLLGLPLGCAVRDPAPVQETAAIALGDTVQVPEDAFKAETMQATKDQIRDGWIPEFGDPVLDDLVYEALNNNLNIQAAIARVDAAAGFAVQAGAELKPALALGASALSADGLHSGTPGLASTGVALNASWEIDVWGRVRAQAAAGEAALEASQDMLSAAYQSVAAQTAKAYFFVTEATLQVDAAKEALNLREKTLELVQAKRSVGQVTDKEVAQAKAQVAKSQVAIRKATSARNQAARALEMILGRYPGAEIEGAEDLPKPPPRVPAGMPSEILERRPDLRAAERVVAARFLATQSAERARLPRITISGNLGTSTSDLTNLVGLGPDFWSMGANFIAPIYTGGALEAQVDIRTAEQKEALAQYGMLALKAFAEVEQALSDDFLLKEQEDYLRISLQEAERALVVATAQFDQGKVELLNVVTQQGEVISTRVSLLNVRDQRLQKRVDLHLALGGTFTEASSNQGLDGPQKEPDSKTTASGER